MSFRIGEILESSTENEWMNEWVPGKLNLADDGTKCSKTPNFSQDCRWIRGPEFLWGEKNVWPKNQSQNETTKEEIHVHFLHTKMNPPSEIIQAHSGIPHDIYGN